MTCRYDREADQHLTREHLAECANNACRGCRPCAHDDAGNPVRHCRTRRRCTSHLAWGEYACPTCLGKIRGNLNAILEALAIMPAEAVEQGLNSEPANLAGPHADYVTAQWRLVNADRNGEEVEELDMRDPYTCLTLHERTIREDLGHDEHTLVSPDVASTARYLDWVLTDLARDERQADAITPLLADTKALRNHVEAALRDSRAPERGIPCPACVEAERDAPRLVRRYGHWCWSSECQQLHYLDETGDEWRCPNCGERWTHADYELRLVARKGGRMTA